MRSWSRQPSFPLSLAIPLIAAATISVQAADRPVWREMQPEAQAVGEAWSVQVDPTVLVRGPTPADSQFEFTLPDGATYRAVVESTRFDRPDRYMSKGRLLGQPFSDFLMLVDRGKMAGVITPHPAVRFQVLPFGQAGEHRVTAHAIADARIGGSLRPDPAILKSPSKRSAIAPRVASPRASRAAISGLPPNSIIDVLIVYTQHVTSALGGETNAQMAAALCVELANEAYLNSGCTQRVRLAHAAEVFYNETGIAQTDLEALTRPADGLMDAAITLRDDFRADLVHLLVSYSNYGDLGWLNNFGTFNETWTFSVSEFVALPNDGFTRGIGSNMGIDHDWHMPPLQTPYPYSFGYAFTGNSGARWGTVMSNIGFPRIRQHSNPNRFYDGQATGQPITAAQPAYAALSLDNTASTIEAIKDATVVPPPVISSPITASGTTNVYFEYQITAANGPTSFGAAGLPQALSVNTTTGLISGLPWQAGVYTIDLSASNTGGTGLKVLTLTVDDPSECPLQRLARRLKPLGVIPPGWISQREPELLDGARRFRDGVLRESPEGRAVIDAYYRHGAAVFAAASAQPDLLRDVAACWVDLAPTLESSKQREPLRLTAAQGERMARLLDRLEDATEPETRSVIDLTRAWLKAHATVH